MSVHDRTVTVSLCFLTCQVISRRTACLKASVVSGADRSRNTAQLRAAIGGRRTESYVVIAAGSLLTGP